MTVLHNLPTEWLDNPEVKAAHSGIARIYNPTRFPDYWRYDFDLPDFKSQVYRFTADNVDSANMPCFVVGLVVQHPDLLLPELKEWTDPETDGYIVAASGHTMAHALVRMRFGRNAPAMTGIPTSEPDAVAALRAASGAWSSGLLDNSLVLQGNDTGRKRLVFYMDQLAEHVIPLAKGSGYTVTDGPDGRKHFIKVLG